MKYKTFPDTTNTGVEWLGEIPTQWNLSKLAWIFVDANAGEVVDKSYWGEGDELLYTCNRNPMSSDFNFFPEIKRTKPNDLLLTRNGTPYVHKPQTGSIYSNVVQRITLKKTFDRDYLTYALSNSALHLKGYGVSIESLNFENWKSLVFAYPSLKEQYEIAAFLDRETAKIGRLIEKQQRLIELLEEKRQAVISHAVTKGLNPDAPMKDSGVKWLGEVPEHWESKVKLSSFAEQSKGSFVNGPFGSDLLSNELTSSGVPVIYIRDIKRTGYKRKSTVCVTVEKAEQLKVCRVSSGDVLVAKVGDPPGDTCVYPSAEQDAIITQDVIRIRVDRAKVNPDYLSMLLNSDYGREVIDDVSVESTRKRVSLGDFKATKFVRPPLNEQTHIANYVLERSSKLSKLIKKAKKAILLLKERRTALISAAVTGKIDVRDQVPQDVEEEVAS